MNQEKNRSCCDTGAVFLRVTWQDVDGECVPSDSPVPRSPFAIVYLGYETREAIPYKPVYSLAVGNLNVFSFQLSVFDTKFKRLFVFIHSFWIYTFDVPRKYIYTSRSINFFPNQSTLLFTLFLLSQL